MRISKIINKVDKGRQQPDVMDKTTDKISSVLPKTLMQEEHQIDRKYIDSDNLSRSEKLYSDAIMVIKNYIDNIKQIKDNSCVINDGILDIIKRIVNEVTNKNNELMLFIVKSTYEDYLHGHIINVMVLSADLAHSLGYSSDDMCNICLTAFLHDIGMLGFKSIYNKTTKLSEAEFTEIRKHPLISKNITEKSGVREDSVLIAVSHIHERINKKGYPSRLNKDEIHEFAKILGVIDVYEAMTHHRSYRRKIEPHQVLRNLIETQSDFFEEYLIKKLIDRLSVYPPGSFVILNTGEVAKVIRSNHGYPTRPIVQIIIDASRNLQKGSKIINLSETPLINIRETANWSKMNILDKKLAFKLSLQDWWIT